MNHLALSISYSSLLSLLDQIGKDNDILLLKWQQEYTDLIRAACEAGSDLCAENNVSNNRSFHAEAIQSKQLTATSDPIPDHNYATATVSNNEDTHETVIK